jgi:hypothetical protein
MTRASSHGSAHLFQVILRRRFRALHFRNTCRSANVLCSYKLLIGKIHSAARSFLEIVDQQIHSLARFSLLELRVRDMVLHDIA